MPEKTISSSRVFSGRLLKVDVVKVQVSRRSSTREIVRHPGAVAIWLVAPDGKLIMVRQFRKAVAGFLLEIVAGTRERGESARKCAFREIREETGYATKKLRALGRIYTAPGFCNESITLFYAVAKRLPGRPRPDHDEKISVRHIAPREFERLVQRGAIHDAKTLAAWALVQGRGLYPAKEERP